MKRNLYINFLATKRFEEYGNDWPLDDILALLNRYFDGVTAEMVCTDENAQYDEATQTLHYEEWRGGAWHEIIAYDWQQNGDLVQIYYNNIGKAGELIERGKYILTIRLEDDGSFRYISNRWMFEQPEG